MAYSRTTASDVVWRGTYNAARTYYPGDWVTYNGQIYRALGVLLGLTPGPIGTATDTVPTLGTTNAALWQNNGTATNTGTGEVRLTPTSTSQTGSTFFKTPVSLVHNYTVSFQSECSGGTGADGYQLFFMSSSGYATVPTAAALANGGFEFQAETWSGAPPFTRFITNTGGTSNVITNINTSESTANLRAVSNWVFTFTRTGPNIYTVGITKGGTTYSASPYTNVFVPDFAWLGFQATTGGAYDNQYIRNFSATSPSYPAWQAVNTTVFSGAGAPTAGAYDPNSLYVNTTDRTLYVWNGATPTWIPLNATNKPITTTTNYSMTPVDQIVLANGSSLTVTLPDPTVAVDRPYTIKNLNPSSVTVNSPSGNIDGTTNQTLAQYAALRAVSDGANWWSV